MPGVIVSTYKCVYYLLKIIQEFDWLRAVDEIVISVR